MSEDAQLEGTPLIAPSSTEHPLYESIVESIRSVYDPETVSYTHLRAHET